MIGWSSKIFLLFFLYIALFCGISLAFSSGFREDSSLTRRASLEKVLVPTFASILLTHDAFADETGTKDVTFEITTTGAESSSGIHVFNRVKEGQFGYTINLPMDTKPSNKPLQTHLDEVNLPTGQNGYSYGITVDPIRIQSLREFGTPNEVAAKIVMAELRRDGVLDVTVGRDPVEDPVTGGYDVEYISDGKRGKKHFVTRTIVSGGKLYVLTVQVKEEDWNSKIEKQVFDSVSSFRVL